MLDIFATQSSTGVYGGQGERLVNWFLRPSSGATNGELIAASGLVETAAVGADIVARVAFQGVLHVVAGGRLYSVSGATVTALGEVATGPAQMAASGSQLAVVAGGQYFIYDGSTVAAYDTGQVETPKGVVQTDGYFIVWGDGGGRSDAFAVSNLDNGTVFNGLDFAYAESDPDALVGMAVDHGEVWMFGGRSIEVWINTGNADFPFERQTGLRRERGCLDGATIAADDNSLFWVGEDREVYRTNGGATPVITTREIAEILKTATILGGFTFSDRGHKFYALRTATTTFCHDLTTGLWSERASGGDFVPWSASGAARVAGTQFLTTTSGKVATLSPEVFEDDGRRLVCLAQTKPMVQGNRRFRLSAIRVVMRAGGFGDQEEENDLILQTSHDGREWGRERKARLQGVGRYGQTAHWPTAGAFRWAQMRIKYSAPQQRDVIGVSYAVS